MNFADRISFCVQKFGPLLVGLDPHIDYLPRFILEHELEEKGKTWEALAQAVVRTNQKLLDELHDIVGMIKIQMAFYEMLGIPGMLALQSTIEYARSLGYIIILDGKRNDISSTALAYARGYLSTISFPGGQLESFWKVDALTINPYLGEDGIIPFVDEANKTDKGIFVLCRTSNKSAPTIQDVSGPEKVYVKVAKMVETLGEKMIGESGFSSIGIVVGATYPEDLKYLRSNFPSLLFLIPGVGTQQGDIKSLVNAFQGNGLGAIVNVSRDVIFAYREDSNNISGEDFEKKARDRAVYYQEKFWELFR
ncbi:MAG: orotidine-5'-phosphate decarboxylase [Candidatus Atribacteria bacterium]|nr:orotidine-5'-phosphate decarboxylase [Candidatus Atribacteria bacterium]